MKFFLRLINNLTKFLLLFILLQIPGAIIVGIYFICNRGEIKRLPFLLRWFDGADQYFGRDTSVYDEVMKGTALQKWIWLCWRNPLNYFGYKYLGINITKPVSDLVYIKYGNVNEIKNIGDGTSDQPGYFYREISINDSVYYEYYWIFKYAPTKCFRVRIGWKIGQQIPAEEGHTQWVFVISPYHSYNGI